MPPVTTSLPLLNSRSVQLGLASRIVMAANLRRSYDDPGKTSLIACRSMGILVLSICAVDTMLWITGAGISGSSGPGAAAMEHRCRGVYSRFRIVSISTLVGARAPGQ